MGFFTLWLVNQTMLNGILDSGKLQGITYYFKSHNYLAITCTTIKTPWVIKDINVPALCTISFSVEYRVSDFYLPEIRKQLLPRKRQTLI